MEFEVKLGIYKGTSPNGSVYIGQSEHLLKRIDNYKYGCVGQHRLHNSIMKYGYETHTFEILKELPKDTPQDIMDAWEILYWKHQLDLGFDVMNIRYPGKGSGVRYKGYSSSLKGKKWEDIHGEKDAKRMREEHSKKLKGINKGPKTEEHKRKISENLTGRTKIELYGEEKAKELKEQSSKFMHELLIGKTLEERLGKEKAESMKAKLKVYIGDKSSGGETKWMNKNGVCKRIKQKDIQNFLNEGWVMGRLNVRGMKRSKEIYQFDLNNNLIQIWSSINKARVAFKDHGAISKCANGDGIYKTAYGFIWKFKTNKNDTF